MVDYRLPFTDSTTRKHKTRRSQQSSRLPDRKPLIFLPPNSRVFARILFRFLALLRFYRPPPVLISQFDKFGDRCLATSGVHVSGCTLLTRELFCGQRCHDRENKNYFQSYCFREKRIHPDSIASGMV